jgi:hypothetical protein
MNLEMDLYNPCWGPKNTGFPRKNKGVRSEWHVGTYFQPFQHGSSASSKRREVEKCLCLLL